MALPHPCTTDVVYSAMRKLALQQQQESARAAAAAPVAEAEVVDGEEAEGATGSMRITALSVSPSAVQRGSSAGQSAARAV